MLEGTKRRRLPDQPNTNAVDDWDSWMLEGTWAVGADKAGVDAVGEETGLASTLEEVDTVDDEIDSEVDIEDVSWVLVGIWILKWGKSGWGVWQRVARPRLEFRDRDFYNFSLNIETETETENFKVSMLRPRLQISKFRI